MVASVKADIRIAQSHVRFTPKWAREAPRSCKKFARRQNSRHDPLDPGFGGFCPPPMLEDDMATFTRSQSLLVSAGAGALSGAALLTVLGGNIFTVAGAGATAIDLSPSDFPICHTPAAIGLPSIVLRLAQTEVPRAEMSAAKSAPAFADTEPPLWPGLGAVTYEITTTNERAQAYFDQGLRLTYAFNHGEAQRAFRMAQKLDPNCAMCFWGEALVLGPNINLPMQEDALAPAYAAAQKAKALAGDASPREQALINALAARYGSDPKAARPPFDAAYASEMAKVAKQFPDDDEIATFYAEAVMDLSPWNYWKPGGREPNPQSVPIVPTLERVLVRNPTHPGAIHYYIHAVEASDRPKRAEPYAEPHLLSRRPLSRRVERQQNCGRRRRKISGRRQSTDGRLPAGLLSAQRALRDGISPTGRRRPDRDRGGREIGSTYPQRSRAGHRDGATRQGGAVFRARAV